MYIHTYALTSSYMCIYIHTYIRACKLLYISAYIHTYITACKALRYAPALIYAAHAAI